MTYIYELIAKYSKAIISLVFTFNNFNEPLTGLIFICVELLLF